MQAIDCGGTRLRASLVVSTVSTEDAVARSSKDWKGVWREVPWVKGRPSEYVREHFRFTTAPAHLASDPAVLDQLLEMLGGPDMLVYTSDYPREHGDGLPALLERLSDEQRHRVLWGTAAGLYELGG